MRTPNLFSIAAIVAFVLAPGNYTRKIGNHDYILHVPSTYKGDKAVPILVTNNIYSR